jgi:hypothetical protein
MPKPITLLVAAIAFVGLAACPKPVANEIDLDSGALHLVPVTGVTPRITREQAARDFDHSPTYPKAPVVPILGRVTTAAKPSPNEKVSNLRNVLAWVYITHPDYSGDRGCLPLRPTSTPPANPSKAIAFIIDASTGIAYKYVGDGPMSCGYLYRPLMAIAEMFVSVPMTYRNHVVRISLPPCGTLSGYGAQQALARVFFMPCGTRKGSDFQDHIKGRFYPSSHLQLGILCGPAYDPAIPKPSDCTST